MNLIVFGASGRVGQCFLRKATAASHAVTAFLRDPAKVQDPRGLTIITGDVRNREAVERALVARFDAVVVCIGQSGLKPSTIISEGVAVIVAAMTAQGHRRFLGVSGSAEIQEKTLGGRIYTALLRLTPVGNAIRDHDKGLRVLENSNLDWVLAGCNYLADGPERGKYRTSLVFSGGFKRIHPPDVADFLLNEIVAQRFHRQVVGIWY